MEYKFSPELRGKLIDYFLRKHKVDISQETADEYLSSMAGLYSTFKKRNGKRKRLRKVKKKSPSKKRNLPSNGLAEKYEDESIQIPNSISF